MTCSTVALCKLLEHGIASNDNRLNDITVKGEEMFITDGIRTRSQTQIQPPQWTHIPLLVKIYKLLVNELSLEIELNMARDEDEEEVSVKNLQVDVVAVLIVGKDFMCNGCCLL